MGRGWEEEEEWVWSISAFAIRLGLGRVWRGHLIGNLLTSLLLCVCIGEELLIYFEKGEAGMKIEKGIK